MARSRLYIAIAAACIALANVGIAIKEATERIQGFMWSVAAFVVRSIAYPQTWLTPALAGPALHDPRREYDAPAASFLRHEANVSRRSADRHT